MDRYSKELAQRVRRMPVYSVPISYHLKESDRIGFKKEIQVKEVAVNMGRQPATGRTITVDKSKAEGLLGYFHIYYDDPEQTDTDRMAMASLALQKGSIIFSLPVISGITDDREKKSVNISKLLRKGIDYTLLTGDVERVYKPRFNYLGLSEDEVK